MPLDVNAVSAYLAANPDVDAAALNDYLTEIDAPPAPAREALPESAPIPGQGGPSLARPAASNSVPQGNMRAADVRARDEWDVDLKCPDVAGIAADAVRAAREAYDVYDEYVSDHYPVLRDDWLERAVDREARALAEYVDAGKTPPKGRESEVDKATRERPLALATARKLRNDVHRADSAAMDAFNAAAPDALPRLRSSVSDALSDAERALSEFVKATARANAAHREYTAVRIRVERPLPTVADAMRRQLIDGASGVSRLDDAVRDAKRRVGPVADGAE